MVYQHQVITLLNNYFESTNSTMRDFAQENRELIAALAEEHEKSRSLENKIEKLSKQLKKKKIIIVLCVLETSKSFLTILPIM